MNCEFHETTVHGYFDGELDAVRAAEFERHLETCAECQAELRSIQSLRRRFQQSQLFEPASRELRERIHKQLAPDRTASSAKLVSGWRRFLIPALGTVAAAGVLAVVFLVFQSHNQSPLMAAELVDAHVRSLQLGHLTDVQSTDQHTVKPWFDGKLDFIPPVSDFSHQGFPLVGGRLDILDGHSVAALVYSRRKHLMNVFVWPYQQRGATLASSGSRQGYNWLAWRSHDMQFCLVSDVSQTDLRELKDLLGR